MIPNLPPMQAALATKFELQRIAQPMPGSDKTIELFLERFPEATVNDYRGQTRLVVPPSSLLDAMTALKRDFGFDYLVDISCVDYLNYRGASDRFGLVYVLANTEENQQMIIRVMLNEPDLLVPSVVPLWEGADWLEREVYDLFGITFDGHPDLRRILLPDGFGAHPLRKDYPLQGRGERHNFPTLTRRDA